MLGLARNVPLERGALFSLQDIHEVFRWKKALPNLNDISHSEQQILDKKKFKTCFVLSCSLHSC